ncbi:MAG TPA: hypothetical protein VK694_07865 [Verrucomicrobiae bacterium]|nr:hypothetical protein [Verrucomicrobiae bacterium]
MLKFNELPPTADTTDVDPAVIRWLAYDVHGDRCLNGVAETCASMVVAQTADMDEITAIGEKIGQAIADAPAYEQQSGDASCFPRRFQEVAQVLIDMADARV